MPETKFKFLGNRIRAARKRCSLTQQKLADQTGLAIKTVQDIERGKKNPTYDTLSRLVERLGISADTLFPAETPLENEELQNLIRKFQSCSQENQKILLNTLNFLAEQLPSNHDKPDDFK